MRRFVCVCVLWVGWASCATPPPTPRASRVSTAAPKPSPRFDSLSAMQQHSAQFRRDPNSLGWVHTGAYPAACAKDAETLLLPDVTHLTQAELELLATFEGGCLVLSGLKTLDADGARALASWGGEGLFLDGLTELTPEVARALAPWEGMMVSLNGLRSLSPKAALALSRWRGARLTLSLRCDAPLDLPTAEILAAWSGEKLSVSYVSGAALEPDVLDALSRFRGAFERVGE